MSKPKPLVIRYVGKDPSAVDPYWDFEHLPGEPFDASALRLWRLRVFVSKPARARLLLTRSHAPESSQEEGRQHRLAVAEHLFRYTGGPERERTSYEPLAGAVVDVEPPSTLFVVNLTILDPGDFALHTNVLEAQQQDREMRFRIVRRPLYTYPGLPPGKSPTVRSYTGLRQLIRAGGAVQGAGYRWDVERWEWASGSYQTSGTNRIHAEAVVGSGAPRWRIESEGGAGLDGDYPNEWRDYGAPTGIGLDTPHLVGAPR